MQRVSTTVVALVGEQARACTQALGRAANIRVELPDPAAPPLERAAAAWQAATSTQAPYLVHDADPLALVAEAWVRRYDEQGPAGELEVAVRDTLARWRARVIELPDYYLLLDPESFWGDPAALVPGVAASSRPQPGGPSHLRCRQAPGRHRHLGEWPLVARAGPAPWRCRPGRPRPGLTGHAR